MDFLLTCSQQNPHLHQMSIYLKDAFDWSYKWFLGSLSTAIATFFGANTILSKFGVELPIIWSIFIGFVAFFGVVFIRFTTIVVSALTKKTQELENLILRQSKPYDRSRGDFHIYGVNMLLLKEAFSYVNAVRKEEPIAVHRISVVMTFLCDRLKDIFETGVDKEYAVCIKLFKKPTVNGKPYGQLEVEVCYGDEFSMQDRATHYSKTSVLHDNSCFIKLMREAPNLESFYYIKNNVVEDLSYKSSFYDTYGVPSGRTYEQRVSSWNLPYRSELVVPIYPLISKDMPFNVREDVLGFLCVDCRQTGGFHPKYDPGMLKGVSDGIYDLVRLIKDLNTQTSVDIER